MKKGVLLLLALIVASSCIIAQTEEAQDKVLARRAARLDAMRQLAETIQGLRITSMTTVKDFVAESDVTRASLRTFLQGAQEIQTRYKPDGTCEVTMVVTLDQVIAWLQKAWYPNRSRVVPFPRQFRQIRHHTGKRYFIATGTGAMSEKPSPSPWQQGNFWVRVTAQGKLMALRAAKIDAYRNMAETVKGLRLTATTTVKDFVAESDVIRASFSGVIRGVKFVGPPRYRPDGVVEVTAQLRIKKLTVSLATVCRDHYYGTRWHPGIFRRIARYSSRRVIRAVGSGVPPGKEVLPAAPLPPDKPALPPPPSTSVPKWAQRTVKVTGYGAMPDFIANPARARLMARRAAKLDACRQLAERVMGLKIDSRTTVRDFVTAHDNIRSEVNTLIRGATVVGSRTQPDGTVEVDVKLYLGDMWRLIAANYRRSPR